METIKSDITGKISDVIVMPKVFKCKSCSKKFDRACMFKRHWSSIHAQESGPLQTWEETYELVEVENLQVAADKSELRYSSGVKKIKCKMCKEILCGRFQQFKQPLFANHSDRNVPSNKVNTMSRHQCKSCKTMTCVREGLRTKTHDLPNDKEKTDELQVPGNLPNELKGEQDKKFTKNTSRTKVKKVRCKFCHRLFSRGYNFRRHWLSSHFKEDVSFEDIQWEKMQEKVEVEVESNCKRRKDSNCRRHYHYRALSRSKDDRWKDIHKHVEANIEQISTKKRVKQCYRCKEKCSRRGLISSDTG